MKQTNLTHYHIALLKVHGTAVLFGLTGVLGALITAEAGVIVLGRELIAFISLALMFLWRFAKTDKTITALSPKALLTQWFSGSVLTAHWATFYIAVKVGGVAIGTLGFASFPAFTVIFEWLLAKECLPRRELWLLIFITIGLALVTPEFKFDNRATQGLLWGIFSGALCGLLAVLNRRNPYKLSGSEATFWQYIIGIILLTPFYGQNLWQISLQDWFWISCLGLLCTSFAYTIMVSSLSIIKARTAAMIISLEPVYAIAIAWVWLGEEPSLRMILGGLLIICSVILVNLKK